MIIFQVVIMDKRGFIKEYQDFTHKQLGQLHAYLDAFLTTDHKITIIPYMI